MEEELKIVDKFFRFREEKFMENMTEDINSLNKLENNKINLERQQINELLNTISEEDIKQEILDKVDSLIADYNIAIAYNNKKYYRQGFMDSMQFISDKKIRDITLKMSHKCNIKSIDK